MSGLITAAYDTSAGIGRTFSYIKFISILIIACILSIIGSSIINSSYTSENEQKKSEGMYVGSGFVLFASFIIIVGIIFTYLTINFKPFAALQGVSDVATITKNVF
jgi:hypothetical protein